MAFPTISVIIPVYNGTPFLRTAVESVLSEDVDCEVIVVDDGSTDGSLASIADLQVKSIRLIANGGPSAAQNAGLRAARGTWITFLDSDDVMAPGGLHWRLEWVRAHPDAQAVAGRPAGIIGPDGEALPEYRHLLHPDYSAPTELTLDYFRKGGLFPVQSWNCFFRRELLEDVGPFNTSLKLAQDCEYLMRVLERVSIPVVFQPTVYRRLHESNVSIRASGSEYRLLPENIRQCREVLRAFGIRQQNWFPWEMGYRAHL